MFCKFILIFKKLTLERHVNCLQKLVAVFDHGCVSHVLQVLKILHGPAIEKNWLNTENMCGCSPLGRKLSIDSLAKKCATLQYIMLRPIGPHGSHYEKLTNSLMKFAAVHCTATLKITYIYIYIHHPIPEGQPIFFSGCTGKLWGLLPTNTSALSAPQ